MSRFRRKPVVVDAQKFIEVKDNSVVFDDGSGIEGDVDTPQWILDACLAPQDKAGFISILDDYLTPIDPLGQHPKLLVGTLEGPVVASPGDWIIRGVKGELYPCRADIFEESYDKAD